MVLKIPKILRRLTSRKKDTKKSEIRSPMAWQTELSKAYSARREFLDDLHNPKDQRQLIDVLTNFELPQNITWVIEESRTTPAVNIYISGVRAKYDGLSTELYFKSKGDRVYFNVIFTDHKNVEIAKTHEEEHAKTHLMESRVNRRFRSVEEIKVSLKSETISYLAEILKHHPEYFTPEFLEITFPNKVFDGVLEYVQENLDFRYPKEKLKKDLRAVYTKYMHLFLEISRLTKILTITEIIETMRQNEFDDLIVELRKRAEIKKRYSRKK
jgi:hypothetical protein